jgi:hypothetical protein
VGQILTFIFSSQQNGKRSRQTQEEHPIGKQEDWLGNPVIYYGGTIRGSTDDYWQED